MRLRQVIPLTLCALLYATFAAADGANWTGWAATLTSASPTIIPSPTPSPTPTPNGITADPLANPATVREYRFLQSRMSAGSTHHLIQGEFSVVRVCNNSDCSGEFAGNYMGNGNQYMGDEGVDFCNARWGDPTTPPCVYGTGSPAYQAAVAAWNRGEIVTLGWSIPNPFNNWQNLSSNSYGQSSTSGQPCGGAGGPVPYGVAYDCTGINDTFASQMMTAGTTQNSNWNYELNQMGQNIAALQSAGVTVVFKLLHEYDACGSDQWWGCLSPANQLALYQYIEHYYNVTMGLHNILWATITLDGPPWSNFQSNPQLFDVVGEDNYVGPTVLNGYSAYAAMNKPMMIAEYDAPCGGGCHTSYNYDAYIGVWKQMPNLVLTDWWWGRNPGSAGNGSWTSAMTDPYSLMLSAMPGH
jgi:hypothetical protein